VTESGTEEMDPQESKYISLLSVTFITSVTLYEHSRNAKMIAWV